MMKNMSYRDWNGHVVSTRFVNALENYNVQTIEQLREAYVSGKLKKFKNFGKVSMNEAKAVLGLPLTAYKDEFADIVRQLAVTARKSMNQGFTDLADSALVSLIELAEIKSSFKP